jgi:hypothetical protein
MCICLKKRKTTIRQFNGLFALRPHSGTLRMTAGVWTPVRWQDELNKIKDVKSSNRKTLKKENFLFPSVQIRSILGFGCVPFPKIGIYPSCMCVNKHFVFVDLSF